MVVHLTQVATVENLAADRADDEVLDRALRIGLPADFIGQSVVPHAFHMAPQSAGNLLCKLQFH